ncbi:protein kinase [Actinoplanes sp. TBRC 11911]|nr:protein kinase [Actinoplanes sp. TBRC 11911]
MDLSGRCVGNSYILVQPIGQGATGTVWRGVDRSSGDPVAVKLLHESLLRQPRLVTRFVQERTILLMLRHRNVVRVRDLFSVGETLGLVMDLVSGGSLRDHLREHHTVAAGEAARLAAQVAAALAEAHELGIVHRDLKPDNILLKTDKQGRLDTRLTDFGIARILNTPSMTTPNAVVGTPHYMAPEAFHGVTASPATDVYALGVLLYELVCGHPPYRSDSIPDLMRQHMDGGPERRAGIPDGLWDVIMSCMAQKPRLRPTAAELVADLSDLSRRFERVVALPRPEAPASAEPADDAVDKPPMSVIPAPRRPGKRNQAPSWRWARPGASVALIAGAMVASAVATIAWNFGRANGEPPAEPHVLAAPTAKQPHPASGVSQAAAQAARRDKNQPQATRPSQQQLPPRPAVVVTVPAPPVRGNAAPGKQSATRSPQPEAKPYGPWQCQQRYAFDFASKTPFAVSPCSMVGRDIQYKGSLAGPGGGTGSITMSLQDAGSGRTVAGPRTCGGLTFGGDVATRTCGSFAATPAHGHDYLVVLSYRYERNGRTVASTAKGSTFRW